jgi:hypothetical protein
MVFVDFWNFQLLLNARSDRVKVDWAKLPAWLARTAGALVLTGADTRLSYEGCFVYLSYNLKNEKDRALRHCEYNDSARYSPLTTRSCGVSALRAS